MKHMKSARKDFWDDLQNPACVSCTASVTRTATNTFIMARGRTWRSKHGVDQAEHITVFFLQSTSTYALCKVYCESCLEADCAQEEPVSTLNATQRLMVQ